MQEYYTIEGEFHHEWEISKSKFITYLKNIENEEDGKSFVDSIKSLHKLATHNCYVLIGTPLSNFQKASDDGEPSGTAGQPMMGVITKMNIYGIACVVTRYFGGIKLGAGGLIGAYTKSVADAMAKIRKVKKVWCHIVSADLSYSEYQLLKDKLDKLNIAILETIFTNNVHLKFACPSALYEKITMIFSSITTGKARLTIIANEFKIIKE